MSSQPDEQVSIKLLPGAMFPEIELMTDEGFTTSLSATGSYKLVLVFRGAFCSFCELMLQEINRDFAKFDESNIEVIAVSADGVAISSRFSRRLGLIFPLGCGLTEEHMRKMGLYISDPQFYINQTHKFAEPAHFLLNPDNTIRYISLSSNPMSASFNVIPFLMGHKFVLARGKSDKDFARVTWGSA